MSAQPVPRLTVQEYLAIEEAAEYKSEFYKGVMYGMPGGTPRHGSIAVNLIRELSSALMDPCRVYNSDVRLHIPGSDYYTYPDVMVVCAEEKLDETDPNSLVNPVLVVEVLSKSTESRDRGWKMREYCKIESLREYALVSQDEPLVERVVRNESNEWILRSASVGLEGEVMFESVACGIAMRRLYRSVNFSQSERG